MNVKIKEISLLKALFWDLVKRILSCKPKTNFYTNLKKLKMADLFEVRKAEGKGLGCFATKDIKRGTVILKEAPQIGQQPVKLDTG